MAEPSPASPMMGNHPLIQQDQSASPPAQIQQPSKRDKRRLMIADKLAQMTSRFSSNRDTYYREQLQALQIDMHLLMEAETHKNEPLLSDPVSVDTLVRDAMKKIKGMGPEPPVGAGRIYAQFANGVNDGIEQRDASLTQHKREYEVKMQHAASDHAYRLKIAQTEHKALSGTLRDRLINSITSKKARLGRDRETAEIGDSNALLLHPSQFGIANPASPGGLHGKRATRYRREAEDLPNYETNKRKRKAGDGDESPAPTRQRLENGSSTPLWMVERQAMTAKQIDSPLYSIDKLFTEKELSMTYNTAALAAHAHMQRHPPFEDLESPSNGKSESENEKNVDGEDGEDADSLPGGAMMERQFSHATRSTRGVPNYVTGIGIDALSDINTPGNLQAITRQIPKLPPFLQYGAMKVYAKGEAANSPASLAPDDVAAELELIRRARAYNDEKGMGSNLDLENGGKTLLEVASNPKGFSYWVQSDQKMAYSKQRGRGDDEGEREDALAVGSSDMERVDSRISNASDIIGGTPMSRQATGDGVTSSKGRKITRREVN